MPDYEDLILQRQELMEVWEDDPDAAAALGFRWSDEPDNWWDEIPPEDFEEVLL